MYIITYLFQEYSEAEVTDLLVFHLVLGFCRFVVRFRRVLLLRLFSLLCSFEL